MPELLTLAHWSRSVEDTNCLAAAGWTDCDLDPATFDDDGTALASLGITRAVLNRLPPDMATLAPHATYANTTPSLRYVIAALPPDRAALRDLHDLGVRGVRITLADDGPRLAAQLDAISRDADRIALFDWHVDVTPCADLTTLARHEAVLTQLPVALCLSGWAASMARFTRNDAGFEFVLDLLHMGRTWIKLGGAESAGACDASRAFINSALAVRSDRLLWGSGAGDPNRPAPDRRAHVAAGLGAIKRIIPDEDDRAAVLVANPAQLYDSRFSFRHRPPSPGSVAEHPKRRAVAASGTLLATTRTELNAGHRSAVALSVDWNCDFHIIWRCPMKRVWTFWLALTLPLLFFPIVALLDTPTPAMAQKLVDPNSVAPEFREAAEKRRAEQLKQRECQHKADEEKVLRRDRSAFVSKCLGD